MSCQLRRARNSDAAALAVLAGATFPDACPAFLPRHAIDAFIRENLSPDAFDSYLADPCVQVRVAERCEDQALLAYTLVDLSPTTNQTVLAATAGRPAVCLSKMYAAREARGTGVAEALCRDTLTKLAEQGHSFVWLGTHVDNARANAFYERLGFEVIGQRHFSVGGIQALDWVRMARL